MEALGRAAFGTAAAAVTVARMLGMGVGLAILTGFGSNRIEALSVVLTDQVARDAVLPPDLQGRPLQDPFVVDALETWAAGEAAADPGRPDGRGGRGHARGHRARARDAPHRRARPADVGVVYHRPR